MTAAPRHADPLLEHRRVGAMVAVAIHPQAGQLYVCSCGWTGWTAFSRAQRHAAGCARARLSPLCQACRGRLVRALDRRPALRCTACGQVQTVVAPRR